MNAHHYNFRKIVLDKGVVIHLNEISFEDGSESISLVTLTVNGEKIAGCANLKVALRVAASEYGCNTQEGFVVQPLTEAELDQIVADYRARGCTAICHEQPYEHQE